MNVDDVKRIKKIVADGGNFPEANETGENNDVSVVHRISLTVMLESSSNRICWIKLAGFSWKKKIYSSRFLLEMFKVQKFLYLRLY